jgi:hypothetical protein
MEDYTEGVSSHLQYAFDAQIRLIFSRQYHINGGFVEAKKRLQKRILSGLFVEN